MREMGYCEKKIRATEYLPQEKNDKNQMIFFGTKQVGVFFRLFFTLYERIKRAYEISQ